MKGKRHLVAYTGLGVVGLAAAALTFTTLRDLALACGITSTVFGFPLAWLVPVTVDAAGLVAAHIWLGGYAAAPAVAFGRALTMSCAGLSVLGNAGQHVMESFALRPDWWTVVLVTAVPPAMLVAVGMLVHLLRPTGPAQARTVAAAEAVTAQEARTVAAAEAVTAQEARTVAAAEAVTAPEIENPAERTVPVRALAVVQGDADEHLADLVRWAAEEGSPSRNAVMKRYSVGTSRANKLLEQLARTPAVA